MSGIVGIWNLDGRPVDPEILTQMTQAIAHRGPDGIHYRLDSDKGMAYLILDVVGRPVQRLQEAFHSQTDNSRLVGDIRLDNRPDLLARLGIDKEEASQLSDAALALTAYRAWGISCLERMIGDFAFMLWDNAQQTLFCARDQMGARPLYYYRDPTLFLCASEIVAILAHPRVTPKLNKNQVGLFLALGRCPVDKGTFYADVFPLASAHFAAVQRDSFQHNRYWDIDPSQQIRYRNSQEYAEHFRELFTEVVACRLRSHYPVGSFLSGGRDSASVTSVAAKLVEKKGVITPEIKTFSWTSETLPSADEREFIAAVNNQYNLKSCHVAADINGLWPLSGDWLHSVDRNTPYEIAFPELYTHLLRLAAEDGIRIVLTGIPGDALVGGFNPYYMADLAYRLKIIEFYKELKHYHKLSISYYSRMPNANFTFYLNFYRDLVKTLAPTWALRLLRKRAQLSNNDLYWINTSFADKIDLKGQLEMVKAAIPQVYDTENKQKRLQTIFNPIDANVLEWYERTSAKIGVEVNNPWYDQRLVEFILSIPEDEIAKGARYRLLLNRAMKETVPDIVIRRSGKKFPSALFEKGVKHERQKVEYLLHNLLLVKDGYIKNAVAQKVFQRYYSQGAMMSGWMLAIVRLEKWLRVYFNSGRIES
jgi:asparagine synthase (glutamine-hydrolysing)